MPMNLRLIRAMKQRPDIVGFDLDEAQVLRLCKGVWQGRYGIETDLEIAMMEDGETRVPLCLPRRDGMEAAAYEDLAAKARVSGVPAGVLETVEAAIDADDETDVSYYIQETEEGEELHIVVMLPYREYLPGSVLLH